MLGCIDVRVAVDNSGWDSMLQDRVASESTDSGELESGTLGPLMVGSTRRALVGRLPSPDHSFGDRG
jgi:hypothetical protein